MLDYNDFMKRNSLNIKNSISESQYDNIKMYVSNQVFSYIEYNNLKIDNISTLVDFIILQLLKHQNYNEIISGASESKIEYIIEQMYKKILMLFIKKQMSLLR